MAVIDNFLASKLHAEMVSKFTSGTGTSSSINVTFEALELACQKTAATDAEVEIVVNLIIAATGWKAKVIYSEQQIRFSC